ncbi:MAG: hypothetical protein QGF00_10395 [Planctomycetota bacterium]|nr:hypothetical protein [Planctomycetota bacterium]
MFPLVQSSILLALLLPCSVEASWAPLQPQPKIEFQLLWQLEQDGFDVKMDLVKTDGLQVAINYTDPENYYLLTFAEKEVALKKIESGLVLHLTKSPFSKAGKILLRKRGGRIELFQGHERRLRHFDSTFRGGKIGFAGDLKSTFRSRPRMQQVGKIFFADDFMRGEGEAAEWKILSGTWNVRTIRNPLRSANAFKYVGRADDQEARALAGYWFWDNYRVEVSMAASGTDACGLLFAWQDENNFLKLSWTGNKGSKKGKLKLLQISSGKERTLLSWGLGYDREQWNRLAAVLDGERVRIEVDGNVVGQATLKNSRGGKAGLFTSSKAKTFFDDVVVQSIEEVRSDFSGMNSGRWQLHGGEWNARGGVCRASAGTPSLALLGKDKWYGYHVSVRTKGSGTQGVVAYYLDAGNYYLLAAEGGKLQLVRVKDGVRSVLAYSSLKRYQSLGLSIDDGVLNGFADSLLVLQAVDTTFETGRAGILMEGGTAKFSDFRIDFFSKERRPLRPRHQVFLYELSMSAWASAEGDWIQAPKVEGKPEAWWHRVEMADNVDVRVPVPSFPGKDENGALVPSTLGVQLKSAHQQDSFELQLVSQPAIKLQLLRGGTVVAEHPLAKETAGSLRLRRAGRIILGYLNGKRVFTEHLKEPPAICQVGITAQGVAPEKARIRIFAPGVHAEWFERAPTDWVIGDGLWQVSNRWQCDPRWSFFSGKLLEDDNGVSIWSKRELPEDFSIECTIGQKMASERGSYVSYARDYNITLCADGEDLRSGYSFIFGGWMNKKTAIVRKSEVVAETNKPLINANQLHRKWYILRVTKRGSEFSYSVDGQPVLSFDDPQVLTGRRFAVWSHNNSLMVARVRVSAAGEPRQILPQGPFAPGYASFYHDEEKAERE